MMSITGKWIHAALGSLAILGGVATADTTYPVDVTAHVPGTLAIVGMAGFVTSDTVALDGVHVTYPILTFDITDDDSNVSFSIDSNTMQGGDQMLFVHTSFSSTSNIADYAGIALIGFDFIVQPAQNPTTFAQPTNAPNVNSASWNSGPQALSLDGNGFGRFDCWIRRHGQGVGLPPGSYIANMILRVIEN